MYEAFVEYMNRYPKSEGYVFVSDHFNIIIGKHLEKSIVRKNMCNSMLIVDIIDKIDIYKKIDAIDYGSCGITYKVGDVMENRHFFDFFDNYEDAFYELQVISIGSPRCHLPIVTIAYGLKSQYLGSQIPDYAKLVELKHIDDINSIHFPESIEHVRVTGTYKGKITNLPKKLKQLALYGNNQIHIIDDLPDSIEVLSFGLKMIDPIKKYPKNLKSITFGYYFNSPVTNLPDGVKEIYFGGRFNHNIDCLPDSVELIELGEDFSQDIKKFPKSLKKVVLQENSRYEPKYFPKGVEVVIDIYESPTGFIE